MLTLWTVAGGDPLASAIELYLLAMSTGGNAPPAVQTDATNITQADPTTASAITKSWSLLPGTPQARQAYRLETELTLTWEANALAFGVLVGGTFTQFSPSVGAPSFSAGAVLGAWLELRVRVLSATQARFALFGAMGTESSYTPGTQQLSIVPVSQTLTIAAADTVSIACYFGASNASQGAASYGSTFTIINGSA